MSNLFNQVQVVKPPKSMFDLTHDVKQSQQMGMLTPFCCMEAVPGDLFQLGAEALIRMQPLVTPVMHRLDVNMHYWFVPNRILWDGWEDFIMGKASAPAFPYITAGGTDAATYPLMDYLGIPYGAGNAAPVNISALAFAAYQKIYNDFYRDQNLINEVAWKLVNGNNNANAANLIALRRSAWEHDYFTSALPTAQRGGAVDVPLGSVVLDPSWFGNGDRPLFVDQNLAGRPLVPGTEDVHQSTTGTAQIHIDGATVAYDPDGSLAVESVSINDLRTAYALQAYLEKSMRAGGRYNEGILSRFGVKTSDARLQRPEYITGSSTPITISEVLNTTGTTAAPQGNMSGHGVGFVNANYGRFFAEEHGYIIGIMRVRPKPSYQQGIPKHFLKVNDFTEYLEPSFANLGEQAITKNEIYGFDTGGNAVFGYLPRYTEYRNHPNRVAGDMRSTLNTWTMTRLFTSAPALNQAFIECTPTDRNFAVTDATLDKIIAQVVVHAKAVRPLPKYGTPTRF